MIRVQIYGVEAARDLLGRVPESIERAITAFAERVHELAMEGAGKHEKTGALVDSLGYGPKKIRGGWEIGHRLQRAPRGGQVAPGHDAAVPVHQDNVGADGAHIHAQGHRAGPSVG
jgi:hypothetical protein